MTTHLDCTCGYYSHIAHVDVDERFLVLTLKVNQYLPWYKRIIPCIKYLFGMEPAEYDSVLLNGKQLHQLIELSEEALSNDPDEKKILISSNDFVSDR